MICSRLLILLAVLISQVYTAPQIISFKDGKLGVNIAGFSAGIGIGGLLDGKGLSGGLYAEAGTPFGQSARAELGGSMDEKGGVAGRLYAGATGGANIRASAGLSGGVNAEKSSVGGYASAQIGNGIPSSVTVGETLVENSEGVVHTRTQDLKTLEVKPIHTKSILKGDVNIDSTNEVKGDIKPPVGEQVHGHKIPHRNSRKTAFLGGYIGPRGEIEPPVVEKNEPVIQKRINVDVEGTTDANTNAKGQTYKKIVAYQMNPSFFEDIFNIPISTLKAVGNLIGNTAANTNISFQKSAAEAAETDSISVKHDPSSVSSSSAHISVETPSASKLIEDIFAIPIHTLGAVNKFLQNNVSGRKHIQVQREGGEPTRVRLGPHARRRANKQIFIVQEPTQKEEDADA